MKNTKKIPTPPPTTLDQHPLLQLRAITGWSQSKAAEALGISPGMVSLIERGESNASNAVMKRIVELLNEVSSPLDAQLNDTALDMFLNEDARFYFEHYAVAGPYVLREDAFVGSAESPRTCRYCRRSEGEVSFIKEAHTFPQMLGNQTLCSYDECDSCNENFSRLETDFGNYTHLLRSLIGIKGKKRVPKIDEEELKVSTPHQQINGVAGTRLDRQVAFRTGTKTLIEDEENKRFTISLPAKPFVPRNVFKVLVKMALGVMPEDELQHFPLALDWIRGERLNIDAQPLPKNFMTTIGFTPGVNPYGILPTFILFRRLRDDDPVPYMQFFFAVANLTFQLAIPFCEKDRQFAGTEQTLPVFPGLFGGRTTGNGATKFQLVDLSSPERVENHTQTLSIRYGEKVKVDDQQLEKIKAVLPKK